MAAPYSPTARLSAAALALRNGDPVNVPIDRAERDARAFALAAHPGTLRWSGVMEVEGGTLTSFAVVVGAISCLVVADGTGELRAVSSAGATLGVGDVEDAPGTLGAVEQPWYVYAGRAADAATFEISTTAPDASMTFKSDPSSPFIDPTRRYLATFLTTSAGAPIPMVKAAGRCLYTAPTVLHTVSGTAALYSLAARVPPHARSALVRGAVLRTSGTGALEARLADGGAGVTPFVNDGWRVLLAGVAAGTTFSGTCELVLDATRRITAGAGATNSDLAVTVLGWPEESR